jgi:Zn-dependent protease with chaperone function
MNFFDSQDRSFRNTRLLLLLMTLSVVAVVFSVTAVISAVFWISTSTSAGPLTLLDWAQQYSQIVVLIAAGITAFIGLASLFRMSSLRQGGSRVALDLGGTPVSQDETDPVRRQLRNVVEEMAIASGVPVPDIFVLEHEAGINAFAAGFRAEDAAIAVTRGTLETLTRDELQGVIAHEFSHILNGDMRLNIRLMGPLYGILAIGLLGRVLLRSRSSGSSRSKGIAVVVILGIGLTVTGYVGLLLGRLIKAGVSRQREYLADASAVQFTRQTAGIAGALKKIGGLGEGSAIDDAEAEEVSHMLFASGLVSFSRMLASHPPLLKRIQAIEPRFTETRLKQLSTRRINLDTNPIEQSSRSGFAAGTDGSAPGMAGDSGSSAVAEQTTVSYAADSKQLLESIGNPTDLHIAAARKFLANLPDSVQQVLASRNQIMMLPVAMILNPDPKTRTKQLSLLGQQLGAERSQLAAALYTDIQTLQHEVRLPLLDLALPRIKAQPPERTAYLGNLLEQLAINDNQLELFEYALLRLYQGYMRTVAAPAGRQVWRTLSHRKMTQAAITLITVFAQQANRGSPDIKSALQCGLHKLGADQADIQSPADWVTATDQALQTLNNCIPRERQKIVAALIATALHDDHINQAESELLRAICMMLDCPLPPVLGISKAEK